MNKKTESYYDARNLYFEGNKSQVEIAQELRISERTLYNWIKQGAWERLRQNANIAPVVVLNDLVNALREIQTNIAGRDIGLRFPNPQEADTIRKLINSITKMEKFPSDKFRYSAATMHHITDEDEQPGETGIDYNAPLSSRFKNYEMDTPSQTNLVQQSQNSGIEISSKQEICHDLDTQPIENETGNNNNTQQQSGIKPEQTGILKSDLKPDSTKEGGGILQSKPPIKGGIFNKDYHSGKLIQRKMHT